ncbi:MAG: hypothetical protein NW241_17810 [Bacteroidia bacterium]|nr:hypothetical protein [Bacteroidia bacterium]
MQPLLAYHLVQAWQGPVYEAFAEGRLPHAGQVLAELFRVLDGAGMPPAAAWIQPRLHFAPEEEAFSETGPDESVRMWLHGQTASMLVTQDGLVTGALELLFEPGGYPDYRRPVRRLMSLVQLAGKASLLLYRSPQGMLLPGTGLPLAPDLLPVLAVAARQGGLALSQQALLREYPGPLLPPRFLHLTAEIHDRSAVFGSTEIGKS